MTTLLDLDQAAQVASLDFLWINQGGIDYKVYVRDVGTLLGAPTMASSALLGLVRPDNATTSVDASGNISVIGGSTAIFTVTAPGNYQALNTIRTVYINKIVDQVTQVTLYASPRVGSRITIKDQKGSAATFPITVVPGTGTIDGAASQVINTNRGRITLERNASEWSVV